MEMEYKDPSKRGKFIVILGIVLALAAGGAAFFLINQAQQQAGQSGLQTVAVVVAARPIPARKPVEADDLTVREVPLDPTNTDAIIVKQPDELIGRVLAVSVCRTRCVTTNMLASTATGGRFSILEPGETVAPDSEAWRAVSMTVPDDRAVGGLITARHDRRRVRERNGQRAAGPPGGRQVLHRQVDQDHVPEHDHPGQDRHVLRGQGDARHCRGDHPPLGDAATRRSAWSMRPEADIRLVDATTLGETTNLDHRSYGLPIPENFPPGNGPIPSAQPTPTPTATPSLAPGRLRLARPKHRPLIR